MVPGALSLTAPDLPRAGHGQRFLRSEALVQEIVLPRRITPLQELQLANGSSSIRDGPITLRTLMSFPSCTLRTQLIGPGMVSEFLRVVAAELHHTRLFQSTPGRGQRYLEEPLQKCRGMAKSLLSVIIG